MSIEKSNNLAEIEISYKTKIPPSERSLIKSSDDAYKIFSEIFNPSRIDHTEEFVILLMNRANAVLGWAKVSQGGVSATVVDAKVVFQIALNANASAIIIAHNHPSGNTKPSQSDLNLTKQLVEGGKLLEISVLDHLVITSESFLSMADEGLM